MSLKIRKRTPRTPKTPRDIKYHKALTILVSLESLVSFFLIPNVTQKLRFRLCPKSRDSTIATHLIFLILGALRSLNREGFRISPNPIFESRSVYFDDIGPMFCLNFKKIFLQIIFLLARNK